MNDRDTFAAAALTGLIARVGDALQPPDKVTACAWNWADAMLAARGPTTDHDAAPAAPGVTLTDAEREVLTHVRDIYSANSNIPHCARIAFSIDGLLARAAKEDSR